LRVDKNGMHEKHYLIYFSHDDSVEMQLFAASRHDLDIALTRVIDKMTAYTLSCLHTMQLVVQPVLFCGVVCCR